MARILIAEDEILIGLSLEAALEQLGHEVLLCSNGKVALAKLEEFKPDLIITDYMMPEMGGDGLIAEIKKRPEVSRTPIILLTSIPEANVSAPYDRYLAKPVRESVLAKTVTELLKKKGDGG